MAGRNHLEDEVTSCYNVTHYGSRLIASTAKSKGIDSVRDCFPAIDSSVSSMREFHSALVTAPLYEAFTLPGIAFSEVGASFIRFGNVIRTHRSDLAHGRLSESDIFNVGREFVRFGSALGLRAPEMFFPRQLMQTASENMPLLVYSERIVNAVRNQLYADHFVSPADLSVFIASPHLVMYEKN